MYCVSVISLLCLSWMISPVYSGPYNCTTSYTPSMYMTYLRVPINCSVLPLTCRRSWKSGISDGKSTDTPLIDSEFITCHEGFTICGYVPLNPKTGEILGKSGVTFGGGVDLGSKSRSSFASLPSDLVTKFEPYFGLQKGDAACAIIEKPLHLTVEEARNTTRAIKEDITDKVEKRYNINRAVTSLRFASLPRGIRTAVVSVWFQFGQPEKYPKFWDFVKENDWEGAVNELRNFYTHPEKQQKGDLRRRHNEADIIAGTFVKCNRALDVVFLIDDSGSVSNSNFQRSLDFATNLITAFPNDQLQGTDNTRFGMATFSRNYYNKFYLNSYTSHRQYKNGIARIVRVARRTHLGFALKTVRTKQFTELHGMRADGDGVPRILIVLTDGVSDDAVSYPATQLQNDNIVVYAIGIGDYDYPQLSQVASSSSHVYTLASFFQLETFVATLTAATCNEALPISMATTVKSTTKEGQFQYFVFQVDPEQNLRLYITDITGHTIVYVSRVNPHPYKYDNDISFNTDNHINYKIIIISPGEAAINTTTAPIYVSVTALTTTKASFSIQGNACETNACTEGSNKPTVIPLNETVTSTVEKHRSQLFIMSVESGFNLRVTIRDLSGETVVYAKRDQQPSSIENDISFDVAFQKTKMFVISANGRAKRSTDPIMKIIYISVTTNSENDAMFTIEGSTCSPLNCTEFDTNQIFIVVPHSSVAILKSCRFLMCFIVMLLISYNQFVL